MALGINLEKISGADTFGHTTLSVKWADGDENVVEASAYKGSELVDIKEVADPNGLLQKGERVVKGLDGKRYLLVDIQKYLASRVLINLQNCLDTNSLLKKFQQEFFFGSADINNWFTDRCNQGHKTMASITKATGKKKDEIYRMLDRLTFLCPNYCRASGEGDELSGEYSDYPDFQKMMRRLFKERSEEKGEKNRFYS
ncbi:hypothetical protein KKA02_02995 [Patescibacteria group bacterium]|nr:hypothetical protein [Patescibacteria group bacterium]